MRFKCSNTKEELQEKLNLLKSWRRTFALFPVSDVNTNLCVWLERVEYSYPDAAISYSNGCVYKFMPVYRIPKPK